MTEIFEGVAACPTTCDPDCDAVCHEDHVAGHKKDHWPYDCPAANRYGWGGSDFIAAAVNRLKAERDQARIERDAAVLANRSLADTNRDLANENADLHTALAQLGTVHEQCKYKYVGAAPPPGLIEVSPQYEEGEWD